MTIRAPIAMLPSLLPCARHRRRPAALCSAAQTYTAVPPSAAVVALAGNLPIRECLGDILGALQASPCIVLQAPPGAGKTTMVPLAMLLHEEEDAGGGGAGAAYLSGKRKIMVLEPRRVAAKAAARRMAAILGERVGERVGYRVKLDTKVSSGTRIEVREV